MKRATTFLSLLALSAGLLAQSSVKTERQYLSGRGCDDMVQWDFMCTGGNNSGKWTKIGVPSCWELQGFDAPIYTDTCYPFPANPPYVPTDYNV